MEILCPKCLNPLHTSTGETAHCGTQCDEKFQILFSREHGIVSKFGSTGVNGHDGVSGNGVSTAIQEEPAAKQAESALPKDLEGVMCVNHPQVQAAVRCTMCRTAICGTCDFAFPGNRHYCPQCMVNLEQKLSPQQKKRLTWSYAMAAISSVLFVIYLALSASMVTQDDATAVGFVFLFLLATSITGLTYSIQLLKKRTENFMSIWIAAIWNFVIAGSIAFFWVIGMFMM